MPLSTRWTLLLFAMTLALPGCSQTAKVTVNDGAGFAALTPARPTMAFIVNNDAPFARQILSHNATCAKQPG